MESGLTKSLAREDEGWQPLERLMVALGRSIREASASLEGTSEGAWAIRDLRVELVGEVVVDPDSGISLIRMPLVARRVDQTFADAHLSKFSWSFARMPETEEN